MNSISKANLLSLSKKHLVNEIARVSGKLLYAYQLHNHLFRHGRIDFNSWTNLPASLRQKLALQYCIQLPSIKSHQKSLDGTRKWLFDYGNNAEIETVYIPDQNKEKGTLCISSQVGCSLKCTFCRTGTQKLLRNLKSHEIFGQVFTSILELGGFPISSTAPRAVDNIVLMGQGEPLYNWKSVLPAIEMIKENLNYSPHRITLSTSGVAPLIPKVANFCSLAISLHAPNDNLRDQLVPLNKTYNIACLMNACKEYLKTSRKSRHSRITFEYVMIKGVNDNIECAKQLVALCLQFPCHVNLMPFNEWRGSGYERSSQEALDAFSRVLKDAKIAVTVRTSRGSDIAAACGQLKSL